jgi:hypothetical protein
MSVIRNDFTRSGGRHYDYLAAAVASVPVECPDIVTGASLAFRIVMNEHVASR